MQMSGRYANEPVTSWYQIKRIEIMQMSYFNDEATSNQHN